MRGGTRGSAEPSSPATLVYLALIFGVVSLFFLVFLFLVCRERRERRMAARPQLARNKKDVTTLPPNEREEYIESVLMTKIHGDLESYVVQNKSEITGGEEDRNKVKQTCAICLAAYKEGDLICGPRIFPCHIFHRECLSQWLQTHEDCPCCRRTILDGCRTLSK